MVDVDPGTSSLSPEILEEAIRKHPDVKCLMAVHFGGLALPMEGANGILELCKQNGIMVVEDAAHALPSKQNERLVGSLGDITVFSFYANKTMTSGEGGLVCTNNAEFASRIRLMRLHGIDRDVWNRFTSTSYSWEYDVVAPGYKYNMADINAAVGLAQFERLEDMHNRRVEIAKKYLDLLEDSESFELPFFPENINDHSCHLFTARLTEKVGISRNDTIDELAKLGVGTSVHYKPIHRLEYYRNRYSLDVGDFPNAEKIWTSTISLPIYNLMSDEDVEYVATSLLNIVAQ